MDQKKSASNSPWSAMSARALVRKMTPHGTVPSLVLLVGVPASGKTELAQIFTEFGYTWLNHDAVRTQLTQELGRLPSRKQVHDRLDETLDQTLAQGKKVVVDRCHVLWLQRKSVLEKAAKAGYGLPHIVVFDVRVSECLKRNAGSERPATEKAIREMHAHLQKPGLPRASEGTRIFLRPARGRHFYFVHFAK